MTSIFRKIEPLCLANYQSKSVLDFLDLIYTGDMKKPYETLPSQKIRKRIQEVRSHKALEASYMTYDQKMDKHRRVYRRVPAVHVPHRHLPEVYLHLAVHCIRFQSFRSLPGFGLYILPDGCL